MPRKSNRRPSDAPVRFHMAALYYYQMQQDIISPKDRAIISNDLPNWFLCLKALYLKIFFKVQPEEGEEIENRLEHASRLIFFIPPDARSAEAMRLLNWPRAEVLLREVDKKITLIMDKHEMIMPAVDMTDPLDKIRREWGMKKE